MGQTAGRRTNRERARRAAKRLVVAVASLITLGSAMPAAAAAATVTITFGPGSGASEHGPPPAGAILSYTAAPGEANDVTVTGVVNGFRINDSGAVLTGDPTLCSNADPHTITCTVSANGAHESGFEHLSFALGDGNDVFRGIDTSGYSGDGRPDVSVDGGVGDDSLTAGAPERVSLTGGPGNDTVTGGPADTIVGSPGSDVLNGLGGTLDLSGARTPVYVDLRQRTAGTQGESDRVSNFGAVLGGAANDTLIAGDGAVSLDGRGGHDLLVGGRGKTTLVSGPPGDRVICGSRLNVVQNAVGQDLLSGPCGRIDPLETDFGEFFNSLLPLYSLRGSVATVSNFKCVGRPCTIDLRVTVAGGRPRRRNAPAGLVLGTRHFVVRRDDQIANNVAVKLSRRGAALLRRDGTLRVTVSFSTYDHFGPPFSRGAYGVILRRP